MPSAVTAKVLFGLEEGMKLAARYHSTSTFERYIAFSSLRGQSDVSVPFTNIHSPALGNRHNTNLRKF